MLMIFPTNSAGPTVMVGWRFHPTPEELVTEYLKPKLVGDCKEEDQVIGEVNVYDFEPWDLPGQSSMDSDNQEWYFLCRPKFFQNSTRQKRRTKAGFWKPTGKERDIKAKRTKKRIGIKRTLVFHEKGGPKAIKTGWVAHEHEYSPPDSDSPKRAEFVLWRLKKKPDEKTKKDEQNHHRASASPDYDEEGLLSHSVGSDFENQSPNEMMAARSSNESESGRCHCITSDFENQSPYEMNVTSALSGTEASQSMASDFENQNPYGMNVNSASSGTEASQGMASDFENQNVVVNEAYDQEESNSHIASDVQNQNLHGSIITPPYLSGFTSSDFQNSNLDENTDISVSTIGELNTLTTPPPYEEIDMSTWEESYWRCPMTSVSGNKVAESIFEEVNSQFLAELEALGELEHSLNSALLP